MQRVFIQYTKQAYKPGSVVDNHLSVPIVTDGIKPCKGKWRAALTFPKLLRVGFTPPYSYLYRL